MKKLIIFIIMILMSLMSVHATTNDAVHYYSHDNSNTSGTTSYDWVGSSDGTLTNGVTSGVTGVINEAFDFNDADNEYVDFGLGSTGWFGGQQDHAVSVWAKFDSTNGGYVYYDRTADGIIYIRNSASTNDVLFGVYDGTDAVYEVITCSVGSQISTQFNHYVLNLDYGATNGFEAFVNGVSCGTDTVTSRYTSGTVGTYLGRDDTGSSNRLNGQIDEVAIYNRILTTGDISELYNGGSGLNPFVATGSSSTITTDLKSFYNSSSISIQLNTTENVNMSYYLDSGSEVSICSDCNNSLLNLTGLNEGSHTIDFKSINEFGTEWTNQTFTIDLTDPVINILNTSEKNSYSVTWSSVFNYSDLNLDTCEIIVENSTQDCSSYTFTNNGNQTIQIFVNDSAGNTATDSFVILINPYQYIYFEDPATNPISNFTLDGISYGDYAQIKTYDYGLGSHILEFVKYGYARTNITLTLTSTSNINTTETIQVSLLYVNIRDRNTEALITQAVDFDLVGDSYSDSYTTSTGQKTITDIKELPGTYRLSFTSSGYANNEYYFQHTGYSSVNLTTYLINESLTIPIKVIVRDIFSNPIEACIVKVKQYFIADNDYLSVDMGSTNTLGEILFDLEYDKYYQFVITCNGVTQTEPGQKITSTPLYITFDENEQLAIFDDLPNIASSITFANLTNSTGYFRFEYDDSNAIVSQGCLKVYEQKFNGDILIDESCQSSASATINVNLNFTTNKKYVAKGYVTYNNKEYFVDSEIKHFINGSSAWDNGLGLWASVLIIGVLFLIGTAMHPFASIAFAWLGAFVMIQFGALAISEGALLGIGALLIGILIFRGDKL